MKPTTLRKRIYLLCLGTILISLLLLALYELHPTDRTAYRNALYQQMLSSSSFSDYTNQLFCYEVTQDSITTAYHLRHPQRYGIPELSATLSSFSAADYKQAADTTTSHSTDELRAHLSRFSSSSFTTSEQINYTLLSKHLSLSNALIKYPYYEYLLGSSTGVQANLPVTLCEYPLPDSSCVETYLQLLEQLPNYFQEIITYDKQRTARNLTTPAFLTVASAKQVATLLTSLQQDENCFTETFNERLNQLDHLSASTRSRYEAANEVAIKNAVIPAYETLYRYLTQTTADLSSTDHSGSDSSQSNSLIDASVSYGLASLPAGTDYYSLLVQQSTGSDRPISELITMTDTALQNALGTVLNIALTDQTAYLYYCDHPLETYYESPEAILEALSLMIREDYPVLSATPHYTVKQVPDSLATFLSPAFYMIPALDDYDNNTIYVNPLYTNEENGNLFTTLAHEGFPGHLYQTVYYNATNPSPIRQILDYPGYVEGWATYVEMNSFPYLEYPISGDSLCQLYQSDTIINLALCSRIDLGVNYEGWTLDDTRHFFEKQGFHDYYAENVYSYVVEAPANYLSYFIGYLEIEDLKTAYRNLKMENYSDQSFHKQLLDIGPADFETIRKHILSD